MKAILNIALVAHDSRKNELLEVVYFFRIDAVLYLFLLSGFAAKHFFEGKVFG